MSFREKVIKGASWSLIGNIAQSASSFIIGLVLARMLTPPEYGLLGMAGVFIFVTYVFVDSGFDSALVQRKNCSSAVYSTIFYVNLAVSLFFFFLLFFTSGFIARFYKEPVLESIIKVLAFLIILFALSLVHRSILTRQINFKVINLIQIFSQILSGIIGICLAYSGYGVWSLVWKTLLNQLFVNIGYWIFSRWRPTREFDVTALKEMFAYSSKLLLSGIINRIYDQLYNLIIGKFFSARELGLYTRANQFKSLPSESLSGSIMSISFPVFANLQDDPVRFKRAAKKIIKTTMFVNITAMAGLAAVAEYLILSTIGAKWSGTTVYLQLLCISGLFYPLHPINLNIITALGRSDLFLRLEIIKKILAVPVIMLGVLTSVKIMIIGMLINSITTIFINSYYTKRLINYGIKEQFADFSGSLLLGICMSAMVFGIGYILSNMGPKPVLLVIQVLSGIIITIIFAALFKMSEFTDIREIIRTRLIKKSNQS